ncbi:MAG: HypC/HybG/HupF family hydrogenase formation chaperone [Planctomycetota bacterium]|jgi:hydrogenase expression/formation protein HypC
MCLGIPGKITDVREGGFLRMGSVDFGGVRREVCLAHVPEAECGDYVIVHAGFAISHLDEEEAQRTLALLREMGEVERELGPEA